MMLVPPQKPPDSSRPPGFVTVVAAGGSSNGAEGDPEPGPGPAAPEPRPETGREREATANGSCRAAALQFPRSSHAHARQGSNYSGPPNHEAVDPRSAIVPVTTTYCLLPGRLAGVTPWPIGHGHGWPEGPGRSARRWTYGWTLG